MAAHWHSEILLSKCAQFRDQGQFIDVRLKVCEDIFPAHRIVLAANSDYFQAMFTDGMKESNQEVIELKDESISPDVLKIVMDSIYTGDLNVNEENVFEVLAAADHLQVSSVAKLCCDFMLIEFIQLRFDVQTYCRVWEIADRHGLKDLREAAETKMAPIYQEICESKVFLSHFGGDALISLLSRDDLNAPSETFVFKSVMQWIKHKKEERMAVASKVIGAVRLGLVDIKVVIEELKIEEMQQDPEIRILLQESLLHNYMPSHNSKFAVEKAKARSMSSVLVAINQYIKRPKEPVPDTDEGPEVEYKTVVQYFDSEAKMWKPLPSVAQLVDETQSCFYAEYVGNYLYVAGKKQSGQFVIYRYDVANNSWETLPPFLESNNQINCICAVGDYIYAISETNPPQRYSLANNNWQKGAELPGAGTELRSFFTSDGYHRLSTVAAVVLKSKIYVVHGCEKRECTSYSRRYPSTVSWISKPAVMHCFDPEKNAWEQKSSTCSPHFGSSLFIVNNRLCLAGGKVSCDSNGRPKGNPALVEVYKEETNTWSVLEQKHIPPNNLCAVEIEGRVYFIINRFPTDSGIRIPPEEMYHIHLDKWENLPQISDKAVLCYLPVKRESLKPDHDKSQAD